MLNKKSSEISTGMALLITLAVFFVIGLIISVCEPKCAMSGCNNEVRDGNKYCYLHGLSYRTYGNPDFHEVYRNSNSGSKSSSRNSTKMTSSSRKSSNTYDSFDDGYEDIYLDDDYDWEQYDGSHYVISFRF